MTDDRSTDAAAAQDRLDAIAAEQPPFARILGLRITRAAVDRVEAEMRVTEALTNRNGNLHGGAIMALADNLGGTATFLNLDPGQGTTTLESKTNFFRPIDPGEVVYTVTEPLHRGRKTQVWQTKLLNKDGKLIALVTQTQMVLQKVQG
ncbi:PaaI family thioesterase [Gemmobacter serpentinus]|uniref:PaaI family thioesterase n=1 Tax=Gemmobacter serpentinus TaxID=2652247 RepID=UPI00124CAE36|nr:PaaI family thioesterase [Gemmobacter serpentinus]